MSEIEEITKKILQFRDARDWQQFHNSKDLAIALSIEASELLELFLWQDNESFDQKKFQDELADVLTYCLLLAAKHRLSIPDIIANKLAKNEDKYPVQKAKGRSTKYTDL
ncbi:MAG: nucleotide pyrophosphohydrolase [Oligoflexus sp.]